MTRNDEIQIRRKTGNIFRADEIPSVYALIKCYMNYQNDTFARNLTFKKAMDEYISFVFKPLRDEILKNGTSTDMFYPVFMTRSLNLLDRDRKAEESVALGIA